MAEENGRPVRGRKKTTDTTGKKAGSKPTAMKTKAKTPARSRKRVAAGPSRDAVAEHAYLLWERGEPGDQTEHWFRAEAELRAT